ncbi:hypothetical protein [Caproicibacterium sp. BJN0003]|uniref:hypothetical protein n=1 Tax=Caproicibacterium sp. BJN0003 TaxID=2994078 RepID=UPI0022503835|nr:hypothetical protein [Caproicibacterium sp. BJN0003]UZT82157.1 hypothetical protein OP489_11925 [Caproicibacterium sp. BJN0003]
MTQQEFEIVKALAYGETNDQIAAAEGITADEVQKIRTDHAADIESAKTDLQKAGYIK